MSPDALHHHLVAQFCAALPTPRAPGVLFGLDDPEPRAQLILNAFDEASGICQRDDLGQVVMLPPPGSHLAKLALVEEVLIDFDRESRVIVLAWREPIAPELVAFLNRSLDGQVAAVVVFTGPASQLDPSLRARVPTWLHLS